VSKGADNDARADARERDTTTSLTVVAGDAISPPQRPEPAPWWAPATEIRRAVRPGGDPAPVGVGPLAAVAVVFLTLPLVALLVRAPWRSLPGDLTAPGVLTALRLSIVCSVGALCLSLVFGVPLAWLLARVRFRGRNLVRALVLLPMVLPPVVGGVALLLAFGRHGIAGQWLDRLFGITLPFSTAGAMLAETFVAMPFLVITVEAGIRAMDRRYEDAAATLGAGRWRTFRLVTLPLIAPALAAGGALCWARALGEFGATITFAGNLPGTTQTMPLAVYLAMENNAEAAITLSLVMLAISLAVLIGLRSHWFPSR
jgi:molybdate transport system permease protein